MTIVSMATIHSIDRAKERAGLNERRAYKMIDTMRTMHGIQKENDRCQF